MRKSNLALEEQQDYKELVKQREENKQKISMNQNTFKQEITKIQQSNNKVQQVYSNKNTYDSLYKFNAKSELDQYLSPTHQIPKDDKKITKSGFNINLHVAIPKNNMNDPNASPLPILYAPSRLDKYASTHIISQKEQILMEYQQNQIMQQSQQFYQNSPQINVQSVNRLKQQKLKKLPDNMYKEIYILEPQNEEPSMNKSQMGNFNNVRQKFLSVDAPDKVQKTISNIHDQTDQSIEIQEFKKNFQDLHPSMGFLKPQIMLEVPQQRLTTHQSQQRLNTKSSNQDSPKNSLNTSRFQINLNASRQGSRQGSPKNQLNASRIQIDQNSRQGSRQGSPKNYEQNTKSSRLHTRQGSQQGSPKNSRRDRRVSQSTKHKNFVKQMFNKNEKKVENEICNENFENTQMNIIQKKLRTGEDAISFFAKYGNSTAVKFINCVRADINEQGDYRPYDLICINLSENQKENILMEYFSISSNGIVHQWTDKGKKISKNQEDTQVISLSNWMKETTMFNILRKIQFFKDFIIAKTFNNWRANMKYKNYCNTRNKLIQDSFIAKPGFVNRLMQINELIFHLQNVKTISPNISNQNTLENDEFKQDQRQYRAQASVHYKDVIELVLEQCNGLINEIFSRTQVKDKEQDDWRSGWQKQQKLPMNQVRKDDEERLYLYQRAQRDKEKVRNMIRLVDYLMEETLYSTNLVSIQMLFDEMKKTSRKQALFSTVVTFDTNGMLFTPDERDVTDMLLNLIDDMILTVKNTTRVIVKLDKYVQNEHYQQQPSLCDVQQMITESVCFQFLREQIKLKVKQDFIAAHKYVSDNYEKCKDIHNYSMLCDLEQFLAGDQKIEPIRAKIYQLQKWNDDLIHYIKDVPKGVLQVEGKKIRSRLEPFVKTCLTKIKDYLYELMKKKCDILDRQLVEYNQYLAKPLTNLKDYTDYIEFFQNLKEEMGCLPDTEFDIKLVQKKNEIEDFQYTLKQSFVDIHQSKPEDLSKIKCINKEYVELFSDGHGGKFALAKKIISDRKAEMCISLEKEIEVLRKQITQSSTLINSGIFIDTATESKIAIEKLVEIEIKQITVYVKKEQNITKNQQLMEVNHPINKDLNELKAKFADRFVLWKHIDSYAIQYEEWYNGDFTKLDCDEIEREMNQFENTIVQLKTRHQNLLGKDQTKDKVLESHILNISKISKVMSVISALGNKDLKDRHWQIIFQKLCMPGKYGETTITLRLLMAQGVTQKMDEIEEISSKASGEATIELQLEEMRKKWLDLKFEVFPYREYKDKYVIGVVDDIIATLDDHQLKIQTMLGTRFVAAIRSDVEQWEAKLLLIQETIDEWLLCQKQWMYLENIFAAEDIQKQLPLESNKFQSIDKTFKELMGKANKRPLVQDNCNSQDLKVKFELANVQLEEIQKGLENYLETKRGAFPRFYFLSNDELLEILSQTRNPKAVQAHLRKCFDNINSIVFSEDEESNEILAMTSSVPEIMPETVDLWRPVQADGVVEVWLLKLQEMMIKSLYNYTKTALKTCPEKLDLIQEWLFSYPAQAIIVVDQIKWTSGCVEAIQSVEEGNSNALQEYYQKMKDLIQCEVNIVREELNTLQRTLMGALIVIDVHARDVTQQMQKLNVNNLNDFQWSKQLRFYWIPEGKSKTDGDCVAKQTNSSFNYSYEYLGNGPRLVITPLTDKCYITLTSAKHLQYGGAPEGPAGTGKTETTKDLAKAIAIQCVVFNCSDGLDVKTMARFFSGLSQCGAWACFDEFNRIDIEVLSVIAQQILNIQTSIREKKDIFLFEGREISLNSRFGVFITMNPGYEGRTELPDNLKTLFRPIAMMIPDYALIAEIILFSEGFDQANILAQKMVKLYSLSSQQLSKQDHYDFGMRAVKSVLVSAGILRRQYSDLSEDVVLIRAMRDSNLPKFLKDDVHLFFGIIDDLFPGVQVPFIDYGNVRKTIESQLDLMNYSKPEKFIGKIIQLLETIMVRHGVMVVGSASTGKTTNINILAKTLAQLHKEGSTDFWHKPVNMEWLNPKAVKLDELFGYTKILTNEWTDGIAAKIIRENAKETTDVKQWVVFDGPVDYSWTENMNTVLDDNRMLCLNNGQRIKLPGTFEMIFEVNDLASASPATVSRVGMVYMETIHLGWEPLVEHWGYKWRGENLDKEGKIPGYINNMVDRIKNFFTEYFKEIKDKVKEVIPCVEANLIQSCLYLMSFCWEDCKAVHQNFYGLEPFEIDNLTNMVFIFAFIWSAGGNLHDNPRDNSRVQFSNQIRSKIMKIYQGFPYENEVYDFYPNYQEKAFKPWSDQLKDFKFNQSQPYFNILVPTTDTTKFSYLMQKLVINDRHMLMMGETGVGKSVIVNDFMMALDPEKFSSVTLNFSAQTSTKNLQDLFMDKDKFPKKKKDVIGPAFGRKMIIFIDDINMPATEAQGSQPVNELLRQIIDNGGFYDLKKLLFINVTNCVFIAACASPEGGRNHVTPRLFRHFNMIWAPELSQRSIETIFIQILKGFLAGSPFKGIEKFTVPIVKSTVDIYTKITKELLPTPKKSHYTFNLRDISKIFQGVLMVQYEILKEKMDLIQLWTHECIRVFSDRLVDDHDRQWLYQRMVEHLHNNFDYEWRVEYFSNFLYGNYANDQKDYCQINNFGALPNKFNDYMNMYNSNQTKSLNIVFFMDAIRHISRLIRTLQQNRGNSMLIGVGGVGRQSLTRLATFIREYTFFSIEITKGYREPQWKEDIKKLLKSAGAKNQPQVFLFSDTQIIRESFLEDINNLLNIGEVPNLWGIDDYEEILIEIRQYTRENNVGNSKEAQLKFFVQLVRENLHIVLAFSPIGDKLRNRCRMFPSIVNCCAIDWYDKWTDEALHQVAIKEYSEQDRLGLVPYAEKLSAISVKIHQDVHNLTGIFYEELKRTNYVTPTSYLEHMKLYFELLKIKQYTLPAMISKYQGGLETIRDTSAEVNKLQKQIIEFRPRLVQMAHENGKLLIELEGKTSLANATERMCQKETNEAQIIRDEVSDQRISCQKDLEEAMPILRKAQEAVKKIDKNAINEMKSMKNPPILVRLVMESCCLLLGDQEDWPTAQRVLSRMNFREQLLEFNVDQCEQKKWLKFKNVYLNNPDYNETKIHTVSTAALAILQWAQASEKYYQVKRIVEPKQKRLKEAEAMLNLVEDNLAKKEVALKDVQDNVIMLQQNLDSSTRKALILKNQQEDAQVKLNRAEKLVGGLSGEAVRWKECEVLYSGYLVNLIGNLLISSACISYLGVFTQSYRQEMIDQWIKDCKIQEIPVAEDYTLASMLTDGEQLQKWQENGLPADSCSVDNSIYIFNSKRWPLIIDPQCQANRFIKNLGVDYVTKLQDPNFLKSIENSMRFGQKVLIENIEEELDPSLEPVLLKQTTKRGAQLILRLGDQDVPYSNDFRLFMTSKMPNPHYIPEICIKTTVINFTVSAIGLEDQLLVEVVRFERLELEEKRIKLILEISQCKRQIQELEDRILRQINEATGRILEDEEVINTLDIAKLTSDTVNLRLEQSKITSEEINAAREIYRPVAKRGSVLYFVIASLANIDPMYQYSLEFFIMLFKIRLEKAASPPEQNKKIEALVLDITQSCYIIICRGLFEKDKLLYSFMISIQINLESKEINQREWSYFLRGFPGELTITDDQKYPAWCSEKTFRLILGLSKESTLFVCFPDIINDSQEQFTFSQINKSKEPWDDQLPKMFKGKLNSFQKLLFFKILREDRLTQLVQKYVGETLGEIFTQSPRFDLKACYMDSTCRTPIIFVLSPGADPIGYLHLLAKEQLFAERLKTLSLGQGQGDIAKELIKSGRRNGDWVCLQNCHLAISWMSEFEYIQETQVENDTHPDYRLWLTSMPSSKFPVPVLQNGIKLTNEPPKGLKQNIMDKVNSFDEKTYYSNNKSDYKSRQYQKLLYSLAFFHSVILERKKFGAIGWNIQYEWMNSDFQTSQTQLYMNLNEQPQIPYQTLTYIIATINYGGRVTDDKDDLCITALLNRYFNPDVFKANYEFAPGGVYLSPQELGLDAIKELVKNLPYEDDPEVFGLHPNAQISYNNKIVSNFLETLILCQPRIAVGKSGSLKPEDIVSQMATRILQEMPEKLQIKKIEESQNSLEVFRYQEVNMLNTLIAKIKITLADLVKAIQGTVVMSIQLESIFDSFILKKVPWIWEKIAYPSLKPLASWVPDLLARIAFMNDWVVKSYMHSYWISSFFFPQGFFTAALQQFSRKTHIAIDTLIFRTEVRKVSRAESRQPESGVNIHGLYIEGCRWNIDQGHLEESILRTLFEEMPVVWLEPVLISEYKPTGYNCPLYKTSTRKGTLSTTGHSTNFVMYLDLKTDKQVSYWVRRGVALLTMLDD